MLNIISVVIASIYGLACEAQVRQIVLGKGQTDYSPFHPGFNDFIEGLLEEHHTPGIAIAVVHKNQTWAKGYGHASLPNGPVTPYTLFQGASTTKSFTASLMALLVDNNETFNHVDWTSSLHDLVGNDFVLMDPYLTSQVKLDDILSHRTGIPRHDAVWINNDLDVQSQTHALRYLPPSAELRTKWQYCNLMFSAASHVIQTLTGRWHGDIIREWLFEPLGMNYSFYSPSDLSTCEKSQPTCKLAVGYAWNNESRKHEAIDPDRYDPGNGATGVISNVLDYSKWLRALMYEEGPVSKAGHAAIKTPMSHFDQEAFFYPYTGPRFFGMGLSTGVFRDKQIFGHGGAIGGHFSQFSFLPEEKWGFVAFQNTPGEVVDIAGFRLMDEFLKIPEKDFTRMNERIRERSHESEKAAQELPSKLYPNLPSTPLPPQLLPHRYAGQYHHPGYGFLNLTLDPPNSAVPLSAPIKGAVSQQLYFNSRYENMLFTFSHVSGEHWIMAMRNHVHTSKVADDYTKVKFEISPGGRVERLGVIMEKAVEGEAGWAWFEKTAKSGCESDDENGYYDEELAKLLWEIRNGYP